ncbi:uncharacterized protein LOC108719552 isoform X2 [Xenopus laevis]|uniref:Uncharacterized protein LOC108719552 isoform X2 n=2 Tax=Xenopus laevis TaxID=8355 RepID=A0A1L8FUC2_XENLA|nr:uncharacterized protein LOC108719552 isoform X2 [Xenopus laevis]XP_041422910.1 uncharacterized protein LOC108719552 isoform X2 [Xenopus laevis]OCT75200.1 hypothetical protein XELAEV_18030374mg [Xenopus laevis]
MKPEISEIKLEEEHSEDHLNPMEIMAVTLTDGGFLEPEPEILQVKIEEEELGFVEPIHQMERTSSRFTNGRGYCEERQMPQENYISPDFLKEFIDMYRALPCLWKVKSTDYFNKQKKNRAYEKLLRLCKTVYPTANLEYVKHKIANLRTVFKKELKKVELSKRSGATGDNVYVPRLWYFELLKFTIEQDATCNATSNMVEDEDVIPCDLGEEEKRASEDSFVEIIESPNLSQASIHRQNEALVENDAEEFSLPKKQMKRKLCNDDLEKQLLSQAAAILSRDDDECDNFGVIVASKLRKMDENQRLAAEMIIWDVLHKGMLKQLNVQDPIGQYTGPVHQAYK